METKTKFDRKTYMKEYSKKYHEENLEKIKKQRREYRIKNAESLKLPHKNAWLKHKYGITLGDYDILFITQGGCCAICGTHQDKLSKKLDVDHCHYTNKVRGLLCNACNRGIGYLKDSINILDKAKQYLLLHK